MVKLLNNTDTWFMMKNHVTLRKVLPQEYALLRELAEIIWPVCYKNILSVEQIDYMMDMMYSENVIAGEISEGVSFYFILSDGESSGYLSFGAFESSSENTAKLHKLYLLPEKHHQGIGSSAIDLAKQLCRSAGYDSLLLNVNRQNFNAIKCYEKNGFKVIREENNAIGNDFFMTDYVMQAELDTCCL